MPARVSGLQRASRARFASHTAFPHPANSDFGPRDWNFQSRTWVLVGKQRRRKPATLEFHSFELHPLQTRQRHDARPVRLGPDLGRAEPATARRHGPEGPGGDIRLDFASGRQIDQPADPCRFWRCDTWESARELNADAGIWTGYIRHRRKNPDISGSAELMRLVRGRTRPGGTFATYSAVGWVRAQTFRAARLTCGEKTAWSLRASAAMSAETVSRESLISALT